MPYAPFTSGRHLDFSDTVLNSGTGTQTVSDINGTSMTKFIPMGIFINSSNDEDEEAAGYATVNCWLAGESSGDAKQRRLYTRSIQPLAVAGIISNGTTGRGIESHTGR
jgi:hypothetical protein